MRRVVVPDATRRLLELLGSWAVAAGQPILADLAADPTTFVLRRSTTGEIGAMVALVLLAPPLGVWLLEEVLDRARRPMVAVAHTAAIALCAVLWVVQLARELGAGGTTAVAVGVIAGAAVGALAAQRAMRAALGSLSLLLPVLVAWFLFASPVADVVGPTSSVSSVDGAVVPGDHPDVVIVVMDELPTLSLLDGDGAIDAELYPAIARLASTATFYRNHTAMGPWTAYSVPSIVSSREPRATSLPVAAQYPDNLFTRLAPTYELNVWEPEWLCPAALDCRATPIPAGSGLAGLLRDAAALLVDRVAPSTPAARVDGRDPGAVLIGDDELALEAPAVFEGFVDSVGGDGVRPRLDYVHVLAPHQPWELLPDGRRYGGGDLEGSFGGGWTDQRAADANRIRHLLQLRWADQQLGEVLDELERSGRLDDALVVVTADHGIVFRGGAPARASTPATLHEVYWAPLLIKLPGQRDGTTTDVAATALDVLPTILAATGMPPAPDALGSALDPSAPAADTDQRRVWAGAHSELEADGRFASIDAAAGLTSLLGAARSLDRHGVLDAHRQGPHGDLVGRRADDVALGAQVAGVELDDAHRFDDVDLGADVVPGWLTATFPGAADAEVAIVVNGVVAATPLARSAGGALQVVATLPIELLVPGANTVVVHLLD